jgi:hypothetical protein
MERVQTIYPRYLVPEPVAGPPGLTFRAFRDDTLYQCVSTIHSAPWFSIALSEALAARGFLCTVLHSAL